LTLQRKSGVVIAIGGLVFIVAMTLTPATESVSTVRHHCLPFWCDNLPLLDVILNVLLFMPMAFGMRRAGVRNAQTLLAASALSLAIEVLQHLIPGRDASVRDWIMNTVGGAAGIALAIWIDGLLYPKPALARRLAFGAATVWLGLSSLGAWGLGGAPTEAMYFGQLLPEARLRFAGSVQSASLNGRPFSSEPLPATDSIRSALRRGHLVLDARISRVTTANPLAPIVRVVDDEGYEIASFFQRRRDLLFRVRFKAAAAWLQSPSVRIPDLFDGEVDGPDSHELKLSGQLRDGALRVAALDSRGVETLARLTPQLAWSFFVPFEFPLDSRAPWLNALWVGGLLLPYGYWLARARVGATRGAVFVAALGAVGLVFLPVLFRYPLSPWSEWLALVLGGAIGGMIGASIRRTV
jgi:VanZ family protein